MKKLILKFLGINQDYLEEVRKYNASKQRDEEIKEFFMLEEKIKEIIQQGNILNSIRNYSEAGLPISRYKELSNKFNAYDEKIYKSLKP